jgi:phenylalanine-4-hydroxylase
MAGATVPAHLRRYVVEQDYAQYTAADQAVWRFVLLQLHARLVHTAHPAYRGGLAATGISVDRIPSIAEMNEKLARFGWSAVCVDGFIPPRAFQELQASSILPIAADVRTREHLAYTPAPDILHEAAGHAPILPDPVFASYLRKSGELGKKAFTLPEEQRVDQAIHALSEIKEDPGAEPERIARAEAELEEALAAVVEPSEVTRMSRLYWWTAEYGLVGRPDDYKLYGAGLLSSLGESHSCHDPSVRKIPLDERCVDVRYDITRPQPQLFVTPSFEALHDVLDRVASTLACRTGGRVALDRAVRSRELASVALSSGAWVIGVLRRFGPDPVAPAFLELAGRAALAHAGRVEAGLDPLGEADAHWILLGRLDDGTPLEAASDAALARRLDGPRGVHRFRFDRGAGAEGRLGRVTRGDDGRLLAVELAAARLTLPGEPPRDLARYVLIAAGDAAGAQAGAVDPRFYPDTPFSPVRVPRPRPLPSGEREALALFDRAERAHRAGRKEEMVEVFASVHQALERAHPAEWLLRWNLLESLLRTHAAPALCRELRGELERIEIALDRRQPIASGLRYLSDVAP